MIEIKYEEKEMVDNLYNKVKDILFEKKDNASFVYNHKQHHLYEESNYPGIRKNYFNENGSVEFENINGEMATVTVDVDVYDYYKVESDVASYISSNQNEFSDNGIYNANKGLMYKIDKLSTASDRVTHTLVFHLTKVDDKWTVDNLSNEDLEKIHGVYAH